MSEQSLAVKYRPQSFDDLTEQEYIKIILQNQIGYDKIKHAYLFTGPAGCGKTTVARIFANMINNGLAIPIEIDAASNNGVEQIRTIIDEAKYVPINGKYKVYIMDECHMLSIGAWNALLKLLEEPPATTIFILCTTDPQKIPKTILSRVQRFDFEKISLDGIINRLTYIANKENIDITTDAIRLIATMADGGMRNAISMLDKCIAIEKRLDLKTVINILGVSDYEKLDCLLQSLLHHEPKTAIEIIECTYNEGKDLKVFIKQFIQYMLDVNKYLIFNNYDCIQIPNTFSLTYDEHDYNNILELLDTFIWISSEIKYDQNPKVLIESKILILR